MRKGARASISRGATWLVATEAPGLLMGLRGCHNEVRRLPTRAEVLIPLALGELEIPASDVERYLTALLLDVQGWASWCAYLRWEKRLRQEDDNHLVELLAMRLAWELVLYRLGGHGLALRWRVIVASWGSVQANAKPNPRADWLFQRAMEIAYQTKLAGHLSRATSPRRREAPRVQAVFCIDVRSEVFRRALEKQDSSVQTVGFAGFFGMPIEVLPAGSSHARPQLPGLLAPSLRARSGDEKLARTRKRRMGVHAALKSFQSSAASGFSFVEAFGLLSGLKLASHSLLRTRPTPAPDDDGLARTERTRSSPQVLEHIDGTPLAVEERCDLAAAILRTAGLTRNLARVVLFAGHGSENANNPHARGLDCGACCGQSGAVNARIVAALLNDPAVRDGLIARGVRIPDTTWFLAGLHNTTTEDVTLLDLSEVPESHRADVATLREWLSGASVRARQERAARFDDAEWERSEAAFRRRAEDWAEVRPEWGLADNASFIIAPRERTEQLDLAGRAFLHDYDWRRDEGASTLELLLTAPMVVAHWINFQYYASTVDNHRYGSGNKVLHNIVGGHLGVFEGNGGDLRTGLPIQSLHDGQRWVHTPLRLSVFVEAPQDAIANILSRHDKVRELVENEWLYLFQWHCEDGKVYQYREGGWQPAATADH